MKFLLLIAVLFCVSDALGKKKVEVNHRGRFFLRNVNEARKILASGLIRQLDVLNLDNIIKLPPVGPAANMYRMKWSIEMENIAQKTISTWSKTDLCGNYKTPGFTGFYWKYDLVEAVKSLFQSHFPSVAFSIVEKTLKNFSSAFETLIFIVWAIITYPTSFPIPKDAQIGPSEALYAHRYEMGCAFDEYALCLLRDTTGNGTLYEEGVACTQCRTHCEFTEQEDGTIDEGDLCVPPKPGSADDAQTKAFAEMEALYDSSSSQIHLLFILSIVIAELF